MISIDLPWPPSINHYYGSRGNRRFIKKPGVQFRADVAKICRENHCTLQTGKLAMFIIAYPPDKRKRDLDNLVKATQDALQHAGCYENDCDIDGLRVERGDVIKGGRIKVIICQHRTIGQAEVWNRTPGAVKHPSAEPIRVYNLDTYDYKLNQSDGLWDK